MFQLNKSDDNRHIVFVQFGDYEEAIKRYESGGSDNYYAQRYAVDFVAQLAQRFPRVTVVCYGKDGAARTLANGVHCAALELYPQGSASRHKELVGLVERLAPTDLIVVGPIYSLLSWAHRNRIRTLPLFADSFLAKGVKRAVKNWLLARLLNKPHFSWVLNHNVAASLDLKRIGISPDKILPFDWPAIVSPGSYTNKALRSEKPFKLVFVGMVSHAKGVGDVLAALPSLPDVCLDIIGGEVDSFESMVRELAIGSRVRFLGKQPHARVLAAMREADAVVVPSRHDYPEGIPMTIYEALCTGTPLIASDHPMFARRLVSGRNAIVFRSGDPKSFADAARRLASDAALYAQLSEAGRRSAEEFLCPLKWHVALEHWLDGSDAAKSKLAPFAVSRYAYV